MPRSARDIKLETRNARAKLKKRNAPYFIKVAKGLRLGYYRSDDAGTWIGRRYMGAGQYRSAPIGIADDTTESDGVAVLDFWQAQEALRRFGESGRLSDRGIVRKGPYTVRNAVEDYLSEISVEKSAVAVKRTTYFFNASILPDLGHLLVEQLTTDQLTRWRNQVASQPKRVRTKKNAKQHNTQPTADNDDARRSRRATTNRILTMLKAVLNRAYHAGRVPSDEAWRRIKPFRNADQAIIQYLSQDEARRLVNACEGDFRKLVQAALLTGCRYSELTGLKCGDFNPDSATLTLRQTKSGKPRHVVLTDEGVSLFTRWTAGRDGQDHVFVRENGATWTDSLQQRPLERAASVAKISPAPTFHILRHTHASTLAMQGVPMGVIAAQLGHADTRMTEKHYAHLAPNYVAQTIRAHFPRLGIVEPSTLVTLRKIA